MDSINPATGDVIARFQPWAEARLEQALAAAAGSVARWSGEPVERRCAVLIQAADALRSQRADLARLATQEMGKRVSEAEAEIDKCATALAYYAEHAPAFLADEPVATEAARTVVAYRPLGTVLAVMPWNFPFWQVFRFAAPTLAAGNTILLKHAPNVLRCAHAIESIWRKAGLPPGAFISLVTPVSTVAALIADPRVHAVTVTGSEAAGRAVGAAAADAIKKVVLELGGSDAFIVLPDADLDRAVDGAIASRFANAGQSCIAAKRFILHEAIADAFVDRLRARVSDLQPGDPADRDTALAPLARGDLRDRLHEQVQRSVAAGATPLAGCRVPAGPGFFYPASVLDRVRPGMPAFDEELFGPVAAIARAADADEAVALANRTRFGLGGSVWTADLAAGERLGRQLRCGSVFINAVVRSDPRLPFGGVGHSGHGRELSSHGLREFTNVTTVWVDPA